MKYIYQKFTFLLFTILIIYSCSTEDSIKQPFKGSNENIFKSKPINGGHSWTITSKLGHIIKVAENRFGNRDKNYTILGVETTQNPIPQIWFPGNRNDVIIQITENCLNNINRAVFQVAHESVHCLSPIGKSSATVLEEGLASLFSIEYCKENGHGNWSLGSEKYQKAFLLVQNLLEIDPNIIKKLRSSEPVLSLITSSLILETNPKVPKNLAEQLTKKF